MTMEIGFQLQLRQAMELVPVSGGASGSVFPLVDELLNDTDYQRALVFLGSRESMNRYRSMVDYTFAQVFPECRWDVHHFYAGRGEALIKKTTPNERAALQAELLIALEVAHQAWCRRREGSWGWRDVRALVKELAA